MVRSFVAAGSNLGDRLTNLQSAQTLLGQNPALKILRTSMIYETEPVGGKPQGKYLNAVWEIETSLSAGALMKTLLAVEKHLGRVRSGPNAPRTLDLDILFYGDKIMNSKEVTIPHPRLHERFFVLEPLAELAADWVHPGFKKKVGNLLEELRESYSKT